MQYSMKPHVAVHLCMCVSHNSSMAVKGGVQACRCVFFVQLIEICLCHTALMHACQHAHQSINEWEVQQKRIAGAAHLLCFATSFFGGRQVLELSGNAARDNKKSRIIPRHIQLAVRNDDELSK